MCLPGRGNQARRGLACGGHDAGGISHHGLAAGLFRPAVHSDRGGQYCGNAYRALLHQHGAVRSQSRRGECYDNAQAESLWSRLKTEVLELREWPVFADLADAQASIADYFDYYNHDRLHSSIGYQTPYHAHQQLLQTTALNCPA